MAVNSWFHLSRQDPRYAFPDSLRAHDPIVGRDCGWVEQMLPFVQSHAHPQGWIIDPFCGFGSTLVAASIGGVPAVGIELDEQRSQIARRRLAMLEISEGNYPVLTGTVTQAETRECLIWPSPREDRRRFTLCLTNIPYFGCSVNADLVGVMPSGHLYAEQYYQSYLEELREVFISIYDVLESDGWCVVMAQNLRLGRSVIPLAWDVARLLSDRFVLHEERLIVYDRESECSTDPTTPTNRAHEYALVFRKQATGMDLLTSRQLLAQLTGEGFEFVVHGSFARYLNDDLHVAPNDIDLLCPPDEDQLSRLLQWLEAQGFSLTTWNTPLRPPISITALAHRYYFRAKRICRDGSALQLDISILDSRAAFDAHLAMFPKVF